MRSLRKFHLLFIGLSASLVILGHCLVLHRTLNGPTQELTIRSDALFYIQMAKGDFSGVSGRYGSRILVPFIAQLLPFSATTNLMMVSYLSLFVSYFLALLICDHLGLRWPASFLALFSVYTSRWHLYYYQNPYLTDPFALMILFALLFSILKRSYFAFAVISLLGVLARETTIFLVPLWMVTKQWRQSLGILVAALMVWMIPRWNLVAVPMGLGRMGEWVFTSMKEMRHPSSFVAELFLSWGFLWILAFLGFCFIPRKRFPLIGWAFTFLFLGTLLPSVFYMEPDRGDVGRLFSILSPVMVIACAYLYSVLLKRNPMLTIFLFLLSIVQLFTGIPTVMTPRESWVFRGAHYHELFSRMPSSGVERVNWLFASYGPRLAVLAAGTCLTLFIAFVLRRQLRFHLESLAGLKRWLKWQAPYLAFCYAYFPVTLVKRILLRKKRSYFGLDPIGRRFWDKWGFFSGELQLLAKQTPSVWINMSSGGEVLMAKGLLQRLEAKKPPYLLSTESYDGFALLRKEYGERVFFPPWDTQPAIHRVLKRLTPRALIFVHNAYFPLLLRHAHRQGVQTVLINALMRHHVEKENPSMQRALAFRFYHELDAIAVQSEDDYHAFRQLGVPKERLAVTGDLYANLDELRLTQQERQQLRQCLGLREADRVLIVGSTHPQETGALTEAFLALRQKVPGCRLILAPRWLHEVPAMAERISHAGLRVMRQTELLRNISGNGVGSPCPYDVLLLDTFGELARLYGVADAAYIGASLVPINKRRAGHNILEPLAHGIPPLFGPHMNLWRSTAQQMLEIWPGLQVNSPSALAERVVEVFDGHAPLAEIKEAAFKIIERQRGALDQTVAFLKNRGLLF